MNQTDTIVVDPGFGPPPEDATNAESGQISVAQETNDASAVSGSGDDETRAPEEESQSRIQGDPRPVNEQQPPTKEQF